MVNARKRSGGRREHDASPRSLTFAPTLAILAAALLVSACGETSPHGAKGIEGTVRSTQAPEKSLEEKLDTVFEQSMVDGRVPGLCLTAVRGEEVAYERCIGFADLERRGPAAEDAGFVIGSTGKSMTALAIMRLVDEGRVDLDAPVTRYVPSFRVGDPRGGEITVRQLLDQSSGLPRTTPFFFEKAGIAADDGASTRLVRSMSDVKLRNAPGTTYEYSNWNFVVAGLVVERASGMPYAGYMKERIFDPLGMTRTTAEPTAGTEFGESLKLSRGYVLGSSLPAVARRSVTPKEWVPAGFQTSNIRDLGRYLIAQLNGGRSATGERVISERSMAAMHRGYLEGESESGGGNMRYGFGWMVDNREGMAVVEHGGDAGASASYLLLVPEQDVAVGLIGNAVDYGKLQLAYNAAKTMTGREPERYATLPLPPPDSPGAFEPDRRIWQDYIGTYPTERGPQRVFVDDGKPKMVMGEGTLQQVTVDLDTRRDSRLVTSSRYADYDGLTVRFDETPRGTRITVDDPDKGRASGLRSGNGGS